MPPTYVFLTPREGQTLLTLVGREHPSAGALLHPDATYHAVTVPAARALLASARERGAPRDGLTRGALTRITRKVAEAGARA